MSARITAEQRVSTRSHGILADGRPMNVVSKQSAITLCEAHAAQEVEIATRELRERVAVVERDNEALVRGQHMDYLDVCLGMDAAERERDALREQLAAVTEERDEAQREVIERRTQLVSMIGDRDAQRARAEKAERERDAAREKHLRLLACLSDAYMYLPIVPGEPLCWDGEVLAPHVVRVADEYAIQAEQLRLERARAEAGIQLLRETSATLWGLRDNCARTAKDVAVCDEAIEAIDAHLNAHAPEAQEGRDD